MTRREESRDEGASGKKLREQRNVAEDEAGKYERQQRAPTEYHEVVP